MPKTVLYYLQCHMRTLRWWVLRYNLSQLRSDAGDADLYRLQRNYLYSQLLKRRSSMAKVRPLPKAADLFVHQKIIPAPPHGINYGNQFPCEVVKCNSSLSCSMRGSTSTNTT